MRACLTHSSDQNVLWKKKKTISLCIYLDSDLVFSKSFHKHHPPSSSQHPGRSPGAQPARNTNTWPRALHVNQVEAFRSWWRRVLCHGSPCPPPGSMTHLANSKYLTNSTHHCDLLQQSKISKKKRCMSKVWKKLGTGFQGSHWSLPSGVSRMHLIPPAKSCNSTWEMLCTWETCLSLEVWGLYQGSVMWAPST